MHVRASSALEVRVEGDGDHTVLEGALFDDAGSPLAKRNLQLALRDEAERESSASTARTRTDGSFSAILDARLPRGKAIARFAGDADHEPVQASVEFDRDRAELELRFTEPASGRIDLDAPTFVVGLRAASSAGAAGLTVAIEEGGQPLVQGTTDAAGQFSATLSSHELAPGRGTLVARCAGDAARGPARAELDVLRYRHSRLSLDAGYDGERGQLWLQGSLRDRSGPLPRRAVGLFDGERHLASVWTDAGGEFRHAEAALLPSGTDERDARLQARFESAEAPLANARSRIVSVHLRAHSATAFAWLLVPTGICLVMLLTWKRSERERVNAAALKPPRTAGIHARASDRRAHAQFHDVRGALVDHDSERPLRDVSLWLEDAQARTLRLQLDELGCFRSPALAPGQWSLRVTAPGYASIEHVIAIPHRGEWSNVEVRMQSLRGAALLSYKPAALVTLPAPELWPQWTPREILQHATNHAAGSAALARLTERVERAAYAPTTPTEEEIAAIGRDTVAVLAERPSPHGTPVTPQPGPNSGPVVPGRR